MATENGNVNNGPLSNGYLHDGIGGTDSESKSDLEEQDEYIGLEVYARVDPLIRAFWKSDYRFVRYIGPTEVTVRIEDGIYMLDLPPERFAYHVGNQFPERYLRFTQPDPEQIISPELDFDHIPNHYKVPIRVVGRKAVMDL